MFLFLLRHSRNARRNECHAPPTNKFGKVVQNTKEKFETVVQKTEEKFEKVVQKVQSSAPRCHKTARSLAHSLVTKYMTAPLWDKKDKDIVCGIYAGDGGQLKVMVSC